MTRERKDAAVARLLGRKFEAADYQLPQILNERIEHPGGLILRGIDCRLLDSLRFGKRNVSLQD